MATHSSNLAWEIQWTEEPGGCSPRGHKQPGTTEWLKNKQPQPWSTTTDWLCDCHRRHCVSRQSSSWCLYFSSKEKKKMPFGTQYAQFMQIKWNFMLLAQKQHSVHRNVKGFYILNTMLQQRNWILSCRSWFFPIIKMKLLCREAKQDSQHMLGIVHFAKLEGL